MATASLVPISQTDASSNITSGSFTDIDNTIAAPSGTPIVCNNNAWTNQSDNTQNGEILFGLTNAPGDFSSFNSIRVQIRARVPAAGEGDTSTWRMEIEGTNAPTATLEWTDTEDGDGYVNKEFTNSVVAPSAADIDGWVVHIYQWLYNQDMGPDGLQWEIDEIELILDYDAAIIHTASGDGPVPTIEAAGTAQIIKDASGTPSIPPVEASGTATVHRAASGAATIAAIIAAGTVTIINIASDGAPNLAAIQAAGTAKIIKTANGSPAITAIEAAGTANVSGATGHTASGDGPVPTIQAAGTALIRNLASGATVIASIEASGSAVVVNIASGNGILSSVVAAGTAKTVKVASGTPNTPAITASGTAVAGGVTIIDDTDLDGRLLAIDIDARHYGNLNLTGRVIRN